MGTPSPKKTPATTVVRDSVALASETVQHVGERLDRNLWIFLPWGFFSIVAHRERPADVLVRARSQADLDTFADALDDAVFKARGRKTPSNTTIKKTPRADYPFRLSASRKDVSALLARFLEGGGVDNDPPELDYDNFKDRVAESDPERAHLYLEVWSSMRKIAPDA